MAKDNRFKLIINMKPIDVDKLNRAMSGLTLAFQDIAFESDKFKADRLKAKAIVLAVIKKANETPAIKSSATMDKEIKEIMVLARIREAIGDNGKMMQDELVDHIAELKRKADRCDWLDSQID